MNTVFQIPSFTFVLCNYTQHVEMCQHMLTSPMCSVCSSFSSACTFLGSHSCSILSFFAFPLVGNIYLCSGVSPYQLSTLPCGSPSEIQDSTSLRMLLLNTCSIANKTFVLSNIIQSKKLDFCLSPKPGTFINLLGISGHGGDQTCRNRCYRKQCDHPRKNRKRAGTRAKLTQLGSKAIPLPSLLLATV